MLFIKYILPILYTLVTIHLFSNEVSNHSKQNTLPQKPEWEIYYGEVNSVYSYVQVSDTNFVLNKIEFLFIDQNNKGYMALDTSSIIKGDSLVHTKLQQIEAFKNGNKQFERIEKVDIDSVSFYIRLPETKRGTNLYYIEKNKKHYYTLHEFSVMRKDTIPVIWTGANNHSTQTRSFKTYLSKH